jgi:hypothetical protein
MSIFIMICDVWRGQLDRVNLCPKEARPMVQARGKIDVYIEVVIAAI